MDSIALLTFTNKAAKEMRERLEKLDCKVGRQVGTFHSVCISYLQRYGSKIGLPRFTIIDSAGSKKIVQELIDEHDGGCDVKVGAMLGMMSALKCKNAALVAAGRPVPKDDKLVAPILKGYSQRTLPRSHGRTRTLCSPIPPLSASYCTFPPFLPPFCNIPSLHSPFLSLSFFSSPSGLTEQSKLDFDDVLVQALRLFCTHPTVLSRLQHVLVDEFQDTNTLQYQLAKRMYVKYAGNVATVLSLTANRACFREEQEGKRWRWRERA